MHWLNKQPEEDELLKQFPADIMVMWPVSQRVSNVGNDDADLVEPSAACGGHHHHGHQKTAGRPSTWPPSIERRWLNSDLQEAGDGRWYHCECAEEGRLVKRRILTLFS